MIELTVATVTVKVDPFKNLLAVYRWKFGRLTGVASTEHKGFKKQTESQKTRS